MSNPSDSPQKRATKSVMWPPNAVLTCRAHGSGGDGGGDGCAVGHGLSSGRGEGNDVADGRSGVWL